MFFMEVMQMGYMGRVIDDAIECTSNIVIIIAGILLIKYLIKQLKKK